MLQGHAFPGLTQPQSATQAPRFLANHSFTVQSAVILRELLLAMAGVDGLYITVAAETNNLDARQQVHPSLKNLHLLADDENIERSLSNQVCSFLPFCEQLIGIREFIKRHSRYEYGLVSHALAAAVKELLRQFDAVISQLELLLEENRLSLQKLSFLLQSSRITIRLISNLCKRVDGLAGGNLLERLYSCLTEMGDARGRELYAKLLNQAAEPFLDMLERWLFRCRKKDYN
jgi:gamma-tubulin complex component 2